MTAMASRAGRCAQIAGLHQSLVVNAIDIARKLIRRDAIRLHILAIGVATLTGSRDIQRMDGGMRIRCRSNAVGRVAVRTNSNARIAVRKFDAMNAGLVLRKLICAQRRIELLHPTRIRMTGSAKSRDLTAPNGVRFRFR